MPVNDRYPIIKRIWLAQPRKDNYRHATWLARPVFNEDTSGALMVFKPEQRDQAHEQFELYVHQSVVDELKAEIEQMKITQTKELLC